VFLFLSQKMMVQKGARSGGARECSLVYLCRRSARIIRPVNEMLLTAEAYNYQVGFIPVIPMKDDFGIPNEMNLN